MSHARTQIRAAIVSALTGLVTTADRVYSGRARALAADHLPTLLVYVTEESLEIESAGHRAVMGRALNLVIEARVVASNASDVEDDLDQIEQEVEAALMADPTLGGLLRSLTLRRARISAVAPGENYAGENRMEFEAIYRTREGAPDIVV